MTFVCVCVVASGASSNAANCLERLVNKLYYYVTNKLTVVCVGVVGR